MSLLYKQNLHLILYLENKYVKVFFFATRQYADFCVQEFGTVTHTPKKNIYIYIMIIHNLKEL